MSYYFRQMLILAREHAFVTVCLIIMLVCANVSVYFRQGNASDEFKLTQARNEGEATNRTMRAAPTLRTDALMIEAALKEIDASLVDEDNLSENLGYFYIIEDQTQARIGDLRQNTPPSLEGDGKYKTVPISISVTGTYEQAFDFLHKVETGARLIRIASFTINRRQPTGDAVTLSLELEMLAYP